MNFDPIFVPTCTKCLRRVQIYTKNSSGAQRHHLLVSRCTMADPEQFFPAATTPRRDQHRQADMPWLERNESNASCAPLSHLRAIDRTRSSGMAFASASDRLPTIIGNQRQLSTRPQVDCVSGRGPSAPARVTIERQGPTRNNKTPKAANTSLHHVPTRTSERVCSAPR